MENVAIKFTLKNPGAIAVLACLIAASVKTGKLKGRTLTTGSFKEIDGDTEITVSGIDDDSASDLQEFIAHYDVQVTKVKLHSKNMDQASTNFISQVYPIFKKAVNSNILTTASLGDINSEDKGKVIHQFQTPFRVLPDTSFVMQLEPDTEVDVELFLYVPGLTILPQH